MTFQELHTLLDYHYWARDRVLDAAELLDQERFTRDLGNSFRSVRDTLAHVYSAEWAWYSRWQGHSPTTPLAADMFPDLHTIRAAWRDHEVKVRALLDELGEDGIQRRMEYKMLSGQAAASIFWHMLQHVVNHATYHRGQVTTMLRQLGALPPKSTDLIAYYREKSF